MSDVRCVCIRHTCESLRFIDLNGLRWCFDVPHRVAFGMAATQDRPSQYSVLTDVGKSNTSLLSECLFLADLLFVARFFLVLNVLCRDVGAGELLP